MKITANQFIEEIKSVIKREGIEDLLDYITKETDFFKAPASSEFHLACEGGLAEHSWNVYQALKGISGKYTPDIPLESVAITGMFHDLCKANFYKNDFRNKKINGKWEKVPYYAIEDQDPFGHGEKSVIILQQYIKLTKEEILEREWIMDKELEELNETD